MLPAALGGLRGPFCLRLASAFNHRPEGFNRRHYIFRISKKQGKFPVFGKRQEKTTFFSVHQVFFCP
jgi:hypothetical protein